MSMSDVSILDGQDADYADVVKAATQLDAERLRRLADYALALKAEQARS